MTSGSAGGRLFVRAQVRSLCQIPSKPFTSSEGLISYKSFLKQSDELRCRARPGTSARTSFQHRPQLAFSLQRLWKIQRVSFAQPCWTWSAYGSIGTLKSSKLAVSSDSGSLLAAEGDKLAGGQLTEVDVTARDASEPISWTNDDTNMWADKGQLEGGLYLVGTPIGNLEDITLRALRVLRSCDVILAEDTRHSAKLLRYFSIRTTVISYHQHNAASRLAGLMERLQRGQSLALISDAGMPAIADPGADLVRACASSNIKIIPVPGPSAVVAAVAAAGLPHAEFCFLGFLPEKASARAKRLEQAAAVRATQVLYVAPHKLRMTLEECCASIGPNRRCVLAREITKLHEEFWRGTLADAVLEFSSRAPKGEMTLVIEGIDKASAEGPQVEEGEIRRLLTTLIQEGQSPSQAARQVAEDLGVKRKQAYSLALEQAGKKLPKDQ